MKSWTTKSGIKIHKVFGVFPGSIFPPFADNEGLMVESWKKLLDTGCKIFLPAHGSERSRELVQKQYDKLGPLYRTSPHSGAREISSLILME